ncbi:MAG TPA: MarR family winged helix-turn-helix transcriptional regulator [Nocardioides sp.]|nr:MarR family winged helix-turn-helix transcriptional regulator [Nocardioides sp.]
MPTDADYARLLAFRTALRRFDQWSREAAESRGLTHTQHQLLLAVRGSSTEGGPSIGEVAEALLVRHHTATELVDRTQQLGLVERARSSADARRVQLRLTDRGLAMLAALTEVHMEELGRLRLLLSPMAGPDDTALE